MGPVWGLPTREFGSATELIAEARVGRARYLESRTDREDAREALAELEHGPDWWQNFEFASLGRMARAVRGEHRQRWGRWN